MIFYIQIAENVTLTIGNVSITMENVEMASKKQKPFYRNIYKNGEWYRIIKNNEDYGAYKELCVALFDRDRFEQVDWKWDAFVQLPVIPNPYLHMELPPFDRQATYITHVPEYWKVQKKIDGKTRCYGYYRTREEAENRVTELINNGWELNVQH